MTDKPTRRIQAGSGSDAGGKPRGRKGWSPTWVPIGIVLLAVAGVGVLAVGLPARNTSVPPVSRPPVKVEVEVIEPLPSLPDTFEINAAVEPNCVVTVAAEVAARIERILPREGQTIRKGDVIVELNTELLKAERDRLEAEAEYDHRERDRVSRLAERGMATASEVDLAATRLAKSRAALASAQAQMERTKIVAPIGGVLNRLPMDEGEYATPGAPVAEIVDIDTVKVVVNVPERDIEYMRLGSRQQIIVESRGKNRLITGMVAYISELADESTRTTRVEIEVTNPPAPISAPASDEIGSARRLRAGRIVRVRLERRELRDVILIPLDAVIPLEKGHLVYVSEGGAAKQRPVELDLGFFVRRKWVRVVSGLTAGDRLILAPGNRLVGPEQKVEETSALTPQVDAEDAPEGAPAGTRGGSTPPSPEA